MSDCPHEYPKFEKVDDEKIHQIQNSPKK